MKNLAGQKFSKLLVIEKVGIKGSNVVWKCKCDCENETEVLGAKLLSGHTKSCGCMKKECEDLTNKKFGMLTAIRIIKKNKGKTLWECKCDCDKIIHVRADSLKDETTKSCGCMKVKVVTENIRIGQKKNCVDDTNLGCIKSKKLSVKNKSGHKGVYWHAGTKKWRAVLSFKKIKYSLGYFNKKEDAIKAREEAEDKYFKTYLENRKEQDDE